MNAQNLMPHSQTPSPAAHPVHCAGSPEPSSALPPQLGAQVPSSLQGATGSTTRLLAARSLKARDLPRSPLSPPWPRHVLEAATLHWGPALHLGRGTPAGVAGAPPSSLEPGPGAQALLPRGRLCGECSSTDCRRRTSRSSQSVSGSSPFSTARRSDRLLAGGNRM